LSLLPFYFFLIYAPLPFCRPCGTTRQ
jgi:hypothetical protein